MENSTPTASMSWAEIVELAEADGGLEEAAPGPVQTPSDVVVEEVGDAVVAGDVGNVEDVELLDLELEVGTRVKELDHAKPETTPTLNTLLDRIATIEPDEFLYSNENNLILEDIFDETDLVIDLDRLSDDVDSFIKEDTPNPESKPTAIPQVDPSELPGLEAAVVSDSAPDPIAADAMEPVPPLQPIPGIGAIRPRAAMRPPLDSSHRRKMAPAIDSRAQGFPDKRHGCLLRIGFE